LAKTAPIIDSIVSVSRSFRKDPHAENANALRDIPIQYNQSTVLPLPLHLAKGLEEYLFKA